MSFRSSSFRVVVAVSFLSFAPVVSAQQAVTTATVSGRVEDPSGGAIAGVSVTATSHERGQAWRTESDAKGRYRFLYLPVDSYELRFEIPGFAAAKRELALTLGQAVELPVRLALASASESVDVASETPLVETVRTQVSDTITPHDVASLPLNGRSYLELAALTPAVTRSNPVANQRFPETSAVPGTGISMTGQRFINNSFVVDGLSANDDAADLPGTFFSQEVIREFQVITSGGIAEFGRAAAGTVNVLTQSGTNTLRGRAYGFFRDASLDAQNPLAPTKDPLRQWQYGLSLGGPIERDKSFFFANLERTQLDYASVITIAEPNVTAVNAALDRHGYRGPHIATGLFDTGYASTNLFARLDRRLGHAKVLTLRYSLYDISSPNARGVGGLSAVSRGTALEDTDHTLALSLLATTSPRTLNETRVQATFSRLRAPVNDPIGPSVTVSGVANLGTATSSPTGRDLDLYELVNTTTLQRGGHTVKLGLDLLWNRLDIAFPGALQGAYTFPSLAALASGSYATYQQAFGVVDQFQSNVNAGVFLQDEWRVRRSLTLNLGLRYDLQFLPDPIRTDANNVSPRIGLAWAPGSGRTVVRGSLGLYYDRIPLRATSNALQRDGSKYRVALYSFGQPGAPIFPAVAASYPAGFLPSITTIDPEIQDAAGRQASVQVERELARDLSLAVGYQRNATERIILSRNVNVPRYTAAQAAALGIANLGRPNPDLGNVSRYESTGESEYDGLTFSLRRRFRGVLSARVSYTLSKAMDDAGNAFFFTPQDSADVKGDWGRADNDQRHLLAVSGTLAAPAAAHVLAGWQVGYVFRYGSALPFNITTGTDRNNDTSVNDRPDGVARNSGRGFDFASLDLRLSKVFRLGGRREAEALAEGFNLTNRKNYQLPNGVFGGGGAPRAGFGDPQAAADPRQIQFGLRLSF